MEIGLTHKDLSKALGVSETTIKSYRRKFPSCIPLVSKGKPLRFTVEAEAVCRRIQEFFALGMAVEDVRLRLAEEFSWIEPHIDTHMDEDNECLVHEKSSAGEAVGAKQKNVVQEMPQSVGQSFTISYAALPQELRATISDMARTVVELTLQQKKLMKQVQNLEERLQHALEHGVERGLENNGPNGLQSVCPQKPIHEQIMASQSAKKENIDRPEQGMKADGASSADLQSTVEPKQTRSNPLLKIFGLERHG